MGTKRGDVIPEVVHPCRRCLRDFLGVKSRKICPKCRTEVDKEISARAQHRQKTGTAVKTNRRRFVRLRVSQNKVQVFHLDRR